MRRLSGKYSAMKLVQKATLCSQASFAVLATSPLTMIAAALTIFLYWFFRAFELIVHLILRKTKSLGHLWTHDPRYCQVIAVIVLLLRRLAVRLFPGWAWPRAKRGRRTPTATIAGRWPASCANSRATQGRRASAGSLSIWPGVTTGAAIILTDGQGRTFSAAASS
jgi:hypothetical protein